MITNEQIMGMKTIAYTHRGFVIIDVKGFINIDERVIFVSTETKTGKRIAHNTKLLLTTNARLYFLVKIQGRTFRFYIDELVRFS